MHCIKYENICHEKQLPWSHLKYVCPVYPQVKVQPAKQSFAYPLGQPVRAAAKYPARPEFYPVKVLPDRHMYSKHFLCCSSWSWLG